MIDFSLSLILSFFLAWKHTRIRKECNNCLLIRNSFLLYFLYCCCCYYCCFCYCLVWFLQSIKIKNRFKYKLQPLKSTQQLKKISNDLFKAEHSKNWDQTMNIINKHSGSDFCNRFIDLWLHFINHIIYHYIYICILLSYLFLFILSECLSDEIYLEKNKKQNKNRIKWEPKTVIFILFVSFSFYY